MTDVPSNLIPTRITQLPLAPVADENSLMMIVYQGNNYQIRVGDLLAVSGVPPTRQVIAGTGMTGGGQLTSNVTLSIAPGGVGSTQLASSGVTPGVYGDSSNVPVLTVDSTGRVVAASTQPLSPSGVGTVTSVGLSLPADFTVSGSPVTSSGTLTAVWGSQPQSRFLASPDNATGTPAFRAISAIDVPILNQNTTGNAATATLATRSTNVAGGAANKLVYNTAADTTNFVDAPTVSDTFLKWSGSGFTWSAVSGAGTVTSVDASGGTTGLSFSGGPVTSSGTLTLAGTLITSNGGTGLSSYTAGDLFYYASGTAFTKLAIGATNRVLTSSGTAPQWSDPSNISVGTATNVAGGAANKIVYNSGAGATTFIDAPTVTDTYLKWSGSAFTWAAVAGAGTVTSVDVSGGTTGLTTSGGPITASGTITLAGTLGAANGGTGLTSYTIGDIIYASGTTTLAALPDVAVGSALLSGGVGAAPSWGKVDLTTTISGTLPIANGGTNGTASPTSGAVAYGTGTAYAFSAAGSSSQVLLSGGSGAPSWADQSSLSVGSASTATNATTATNLAGGIASQIPYQTAAGTTAFLPNGTASQVLLSAGTGAPTWTNQSSLSVGSASTATNIAGGAASQIPYQTGAGTTSFIANGAAGQVLVSAGTSAPTWAGVDGGTF